MEDIIRRMKNPEYTETNRCQPCTVVNVIIGASLGLIVSNWSVLGGSIVACTSFVIIYFRGYLVPGTPALTKQYLPLRVLRWFGKDAGPETASGFVGESSPSSEESESLESYLQHCEVVEPTGDDLQLTAEFEEMWNKEMDVFSKRNIDHEIVLEALNIDLESNNCDLYEDDTAYTLVGPQGTIAQWPSYAAVVADVAASSALSQWVDNWSDRLPEERGEVLNSLRLFLNTCPTADSGTEMESEVVESCCSTHEVVAVNCEETGERLFEHPVDETAA